jgi:hypothetical protein
MVSAYLVPNAQGMSPSEFNDVTSNEPSHIGVGHTANVCCLDGLAGGDGIGSSLHPTPLPFARIALSRLSSSTSLPSSPFPLTTHSDSLWIMGHDRYRLVPLLPTAPNAQGSSADGLVRQIDLLYPASHRVGRQDHRSLEQGS